MPVKLSSYMKSLSQNFSDGSFVGPFTATTKSICQGRAFNSDMPEDLLDKSLYYTAFVLDLLLILGILSFGLGYIALTIKLVGGF